MLAMEMMRILKTGVGAYGWLHSLLWLHVLQNLEGPLNIHQCPAQQKGSTFAISLWSQFEILFLPFALLKQNIIMIVILMMIVR